MNLVIVSGPEATGKTVIGKEIARLLEYRYQSKDTIKETLYDSMKHNTWDYLWYEKRAKDELFKEIREFISKNQSVVIESNFISADKQRLRSCMDDKAIIAEIYCTARGLTSFRRFVSRNEKGVRHKGHHDRRWYPKIFLEDLLHYVKIQWPHKPLGFTEKILVVDSTDFSKVDYKKIADFVE